MNYPYWKCRRYLMSKDNKDIKILVTKRKDYIMIVVDGKKLIIYKSDELFETLNDLTKEEIKDWYLKK